MWKKLLRKKTNIKIEESLEPTTNKVIGWADYDNQKTIGTKGSEDGKIIKDIEHSDGARITLEKDCGNIPFAITIGIYGLMFHTIFVNNLAEADKFIQQLKSIIEAIFKLYDTPESEQNEEWTNSQNELMNQIVEIDCI